MCARELLNLVLVRTIIKRKNKKVLSKTFPCCSPRAGGSWSLLALCVSKGMEQNKDMQSWSLSSEKRNCPPLQKNQQKKDFLHPLSSSGKQSCTHSFGGHFKKDAASVVISPGTSSSVLLKNLPRMQGSKQC